MDGAPRRNSTPRPMPIPSISTNSNLLQHNNHARPCAIGHPPPPRVHPSLSPSPSSQILHLSMQLHHQTAPTSDHEESNHIHRIITTPPTMPSSLVWASEAPRTPSRRSQSSRAATGGCPGGAPARPFPSRFPGSARNGRARQTEHHAAASSGQPASKTSFPANQQTARISEWPEGPRPAKRHQGTGDAAERKGQRHCIEFDDAALLPRHTTTFRPVGSRSRSPPTSSTAANRSAKIAQKPRPRRGWLSDIC